MSLFTTAGLYSYSTGYVPNATSYISNMNNNNDLQGIEEFADADDLDEVVSQPGLAARRVQPPRHGGVDENVPWAGGSPDPHLTRDYAMTPYCYRDAKTKTRVFARCEKGIADD